MNLKLGMAVLLATTIMAGGAMAQTAPVSAQSKTAAVNKVVGAPVQKEMSNEEVSRALANPVAPIINMPLQLNWDYGGGGSKDDAQHYYLQIQPVIPFRVNADWNVISRTIMLVENKHNFEGFDSRTGLGDLSQTVWVSPAKENVGGLLLGFGATVGIPTATEQELGSEKWEAGPSVILATETKNWTFGVLANHQWSFAGEGGRESVSKSFVQPFVARHLPDAWSMTLTSEYTYDWHQNEEVFPLNLMVAKVVRFGKMPVSFSVGGRYYVDKPSGGPDWGLRAMMTLVLPRF